jgi:hypothetical protein
MPGKLSSVTQTLLAVAVAVVVGCMASQPAKAQNQSRAWVSGSGVDQGGCGPYTEPCRTLQYAHDNIVAAGGEIDIKDAAGYGSIAINKSISIINDGVGTAGVLAAPNSYGINITGGSYVRLHGLTIEGAGKGTMGIGMGGFNQMQVVITNCMVQNIAAGPALLDGHGLLIGAPGTVIVTVSNSTIAAVGGSGIFFYPYSSGTAAITLDHVVTTANGIGITFSSGATGRVGAAITNSVISNNTGDGIDIHGSPNVTIAGSAITGNGGDGIFADGSTANVVLGRSVITSNGFSSGAGYGVDNQTTHSPNQFYSYGDNDINLNYGGNFNGAALVALPTK